MPNFTLYDNSTLTLVCLPPESPVLFSLDAVAQLTGVHQEMLLYYCRAGLIEAIERSGDTELFFEEDTLDEIRRIEHYRQHLGVGRRALPLVCELRRQADRQEIELRFLNGP